MFRRRSAPASQPMRGSGVGPGRQPRRGSAPAGQPRRGLTLAGQPRTGADLRLAQPIPWSGRCPRRGVAERQSLN